MLFWFIYKSKSGVFCHKVLTLGFEPTPFFPENWTINLLRIKKRHLAAILGSIVTKVDLSLFCGFSCFYLPPSTANYFKYSLSLQIETSNFRGEPLSLCKSCVNIQPPIEVRKGFVQTLSSKMRCAIFILSRQFVTLKPRTKTKCEIRSAALSKA